MDNQLTFARTSVPRHTRGSLLREIPHKTSALPALSTPQLVKETQSIVLQFPSAVAAEEQGVCLRAIENQKNGESAISLRAMVNWCRANPRVRAEFSRLIGCEGFETDPDFVQGLSLLMNRLVREDSPVTTGGGNGGAEPVADLFGQEDSHTEPQRHRE